MAEQGATWPWRTPPGTSAPFPCIYTQVSPVFLGPAEGTGRKMSQSEKRMCVQWLQPSGSTGSRPWHRPRDGAEPPSAPAAQTPPRAGPRSVSSAEPCSLRARCLAMGRVPEPWPRASGVPGELATCCQPRSKGSISGPQEDGGHHSAVPRSPRSGGHREPRAASWVQPSGTGAWQKCRSPGRSHRRAPASSLTRGGERGGPGTWSRGASPWAVGLGP